MNFSQIQKLNELPPEETEHNETNRYWTMLDKFDRILEVTMEVLEDTIKELRSRKNYKLIP